MTHVTRMRGLLAGAVVALTFALSWALWKVPTLEDQAARNHQENTNLSRSVNDLRGEVDANREALESANAKLVALGKAPVPVPPQTAPAPQPQGLTASQLEAVRAVVVDELSSHNAKVSQAQITQITQAAGKLATTNLQAGLPASVKAAVAAFCVDDKCVKKPKDGKDGKDGQNGTDAPAVTDEQLLASATQALAAYCGQESKPCDGKDGKDGKDAPPPYSVVDQDCVGDDTQSFWRVYLSNGTDQKTVETAGPCRIGPDPN